MRKSRSTRLTLTAVYTTLLLAAPAHAIIITGDPGRNTSPAPNDLTSYEGQFGSFLATPIAPRYFVTANHISGAASSIAYNDGGSTSHTYAATFVAAKDDLAVWQIASSEPDFTHYAPLYRGSNELGRNLVVLGRGTDRGAPITGPSGSQIGWSWGNSDGQTSWGTNAVSGFTSNIGIGGFGGDLLRFAFNNNASATEGVMSPGDSGGPVFIQDPTDGAWKLAGINSLVDGTYSTTLDGQTFNGALYDTRGLYAGGTELVGNGPFPVAANSYATRISTRTGFIDGITGVVPAVVPVEIPEPASLGLLLVGAGLLVGRRPR